MPLMQLVEPVDGGAIDALPNPQDQPPLSFEIEGERIVLTPSTDDLLEVALEAVEGTEFELQRIEFASEAGTPVDAESPVPTSVLDALRSADRVAVARLLDDNPRLIVEQVEIRTRALPPLVFYVTRSGALDLRQGSTDSSLLGKILRLIGRASGLESR